jgi:hypothetical protein
MALTSASSGTMPIVAVQGPGNSLWVYWETPDAQWHGPLGVGGPGSTLSAPSLALGPNGLPTVAVQGPGNSLYLYWEASNSQWYGPLGVGGPGSSFSAPSLTFGPNGLPTVAVQGPGNSLYLYWQASNAQWYGPLGVGGPGSNFSAPSIAFGPGGLPTVAVQGPGNSLYLYWQASNAQWYGPLGVGGPGSNFSAPVLDFGPNGVPNVAVQGPGNSLWLYWRASNAQWYGPLGVGGSGSNFSAPALAFGPSGLPTLAVQGPGNSLWLYWESSNGAWDGPLGVGGPASTLATPYMSFGIGGLPTVAVQAPGDAEWIYWESSGGWNGPLGAGDDPPAVTVPPGAPYFSFSATLDEGGSGSGYATFIGVSDLDDNAISVGIQSDSSSPPSNGNPYFMWELVQNGNFTYDYLNPAPAGANSVTLSWWQNDDTAVFYEGSTPVADITASLTPALGFSAQGTARENGDSVNDVITNTQITVGTTDCPTHCGLWEAWNTSAYDFYGLQATQTNTAAQNGADFTITGTVSGLPPGGNWGTADVGAEAVISQYWGET